MKKGKLNKKEKLNKANISVLIMSMLIFGLAYNSSSKIANADENKMSDIQHQITVLRDLNYSPKQIKKIIKMTNKDSYFYIEDYSDHIVIGQMVAEPDVLENVVTIEFKN